MTGNGSGTKSKRHSTTSPYNLVEHATASGQGARILLNLKEDIVISSFLTFSNFYFTFQPNVDTIATDRIVSSLVESRQSKLRWQDSAEYHAGILSLLRP